MQKIGRLILSITSGANRLKSPIQMRQNEELYYELDGQLKKKIGIDGVCTEYTHDYLGRVTVETITKNGQKKKPKTIITLSIS